jgi:hypothetical protein
MKFDPRVTPARPDLAASHLKGKIQAARFVDGTIRQVIDTLAPLRRAPRHDAPLDSEALHGERVTVYETDGEGWSWGQLETDGYVGFLPANALMPPGPLATHRVSVLRTFIYTAADIKSPPLYALSFGSRVSIKRVDGEFAISDQGAIFLKHLAPLARAEPDYVATARKFLGVPYLWGGRSSAGIDCSGLVQLALQAADIVCPRDSAMQAKIGKPVPFSGNFKNLRRGDLIYWKGHIGFVADDMKLLHANAFHMIVSEEPLNEAIERIEASGSEILSVRRLEVQRLNNQALG